jgi:hypothetical protein
MNIIVFWDIAPCSRVEADRRFRGTYYFQHQGMRPDDRGVSETYSSHITS